MSGYEFGAIQAKWQAYWEAQRTFRTPALGEPGFDASRPKCYVLDFFPYPSGEGLHVGHPIGYIATDILARYKRMAGFQVLHPMGFDAFGLPAEQYAVEQGVHPRVTTERNIANMRRQLKLIGLSYDWERQLATTDVDYYRWTQWIFLQLYGSWYDAEADRARPIAELEARLESGDWVVDGAGRAAPRDAIPPESRRAWAELGARERQAVLARQRLAYLDEVPVNWCPALGTVLANEEVTSEGRSERGNHPVYRRPLRQWMLRITAYAERLLADLDLLDWPESVKLMQRNWIGRSEGAEVDFPVPGSEAVIRVFTTRPDTLFGATYMVLAPEHPLVDALTTPEQRAAVEAYRAEARERGERERQVEAKVKTGVFTGAQALNPATGRPIPIWIADYVLMGYGTGAIMAVPGHDERDFAFARAFGLPIAPVVLPPDGWIAAQAAAAGRAGGREDYLAHTADYPASFDEAGIGVNSTNAEVSLDGRPTAEAKQRMIDWLAATGRGQGRVQFKLRDWLFSRQRYWGEPFPILHGPEGEILALREDELPVRLPELEDFRPQASDDPDAAPQPPLGRAPESWRRVEREGRLYTRELNTMPQWAGSCWYYLRFIDPGNAERLVDPAAERYWMAPMGVDLYVGGVEHAVLHLLYARFWHKLLFDLGHVSTPEPFGRLFNQGYILAPAFTDARGVYVPAAEVEAQGEAWFHAGQPVQREHGKMGKSLKNIVTPDEICERHGADALRVYEMYMGPVEASKPWSTRDMVGSERFLARVWRNFVDAESGASRVTDEAPDRALLALLHRTIARVTGDLEALRMNTALAALIELNNALVPLPALPRALADPFARLLAPFAPHLAEELWERLGRPPSIAHAPWPQADPAYLASDTVELVVQVMGKVRARLTVPAGADAAAMEAAALADPRVQAHLEGRPVRRVVAAKGLLNIVLG